jgi:hypothetical protein
MTTPITLIDLSHWVARLKAECPTLSLRVFKTIPDNDLTIDQHESPVAFIYLSGDTSGENNLINRTRQRMLSSVTVELVVRRTATHTDKFNESAANTIKQCRTEIFNALVGWQAPDIANPVEHSHGELIKKDSKLLKWVDTFNCDIYLFK